MVHFDSTQTAGNTVAYFPNLKAVAVGDLFTRAPNPEVRIGGSAASWSAALDEVLKLDFDVAVPATGPVVSRLEFQSFKSKIDALAQHSSPVEGVSVGRMQ